MALQSIAAEASVRAARATIHNRDRETLEEQVRIACIPAPTGLESERAAYVRARFEQIGLSGVRIDAIGNAIAQMEGAASGAGGAGPVVLTAHLDTVFAERGAIVARAEGDRIFAPGISDNARGLAAMLAIGAALHDGQVRTSRSVYFVATVGEEGAGDLRGVKHLFQEGSELRRATAFISVDGAGITRIVNRAIGAVRLRATYGGVGGHSWGDRGLGNPAHAVGRATARLGALVPPGSAAYSVTVARLGGGTSINAIPEEAWLELDLRSGDAKTLEFLNCAARDALEEAGREESENASRGAVTLTIDEIGNRPCGATPEDAPLVQAAIAATRLLGAVPELAASSTDANVPISLGIPAIAIGAGGRAGGVHTLGEWFENHAGARGVERALLTLLAVAGVHGADQLDSAPPLTTE